MHGAAYVGKGASCVRFAHARAELRYNPAEMLSGLGKKTMRALQSAFQRHRADALMTVMVFVWGFHFIVVKDAVGDMDPLTYNAVRFTIGLPRWRFLRCVTARGCTFRGAISGCCFC